MATETVIITGRDIEVDHRADDTPDPKRRRPPTLPPPTVETGDTLRLAQLANPYWSDEANDYADLNPDGLRPKQLAHQWRKHRIETPMTEVDRNSQGAS